MSRYRVRVEFESTVSPQLGDQCNALICARFIERHASRVNFVESEPLPEPLSAEEFVERVRELFGTKGPNMCFAALGNLLADYDRGREGTR